MNNRKFGNAGEDLACRYLEKQGYEILERNKHFGRSCEIDIIAKRKNTVVFAEVKTRKTNAFGAPLEAITKTKFANMVQGARLYAAENNIKDFRIDVIGITLKPELKIEHLENVGF
ncbi:MAG: YraN family protein [Heliobacteriaceae bacterium]|jgi:putative endonuclease|nr:YraN family protein [Heliobacteriaceae bacterium]